MKTKIVIPIYNHWELCHELLWNLYRKERENIDEIIIVDNCSPDVEVGDGIQWWIQQDLVGKPTIKALVNDKNIGFLLSSNRGLGYAVESSRPEDIIILLSTDVQIFGKFISQIHEIILDNPKTLTGGILYRDDTGWNRFGSNVFPYIEGWLLATTAAGWDDLGYFDTRYSPNDFEDVDISTSARAKGYTLTSLNNPGLKHLGGKTIGYSDERKSLTERNRKLFGEKWNV